MGNAYYHYNLTKTIFLGVILFFILPSGNAQVGYGASGTYTIFSKQMGQFISFGSLTEFGIAKGKYSARVSYNYFIPKTSSGTTNGYYMGNSTNGQAVNVNYTERYGIMTIALDAKRYIRNLDKFMDGGFYAGIGVGLILESIKTKYGAYDSQKYYIRANNSSLSYNQLMFRGFGGYEMVFDFGSISIETMLIIPTNSVNAEGAYTVEVPLALSFQLGYKYIIR